MNGLFIGAVFQVVHTVDVKSILCAAFIMCKDLVDGTCLGPLALLALLLRQSASHLSVLEFLMNGLYIGAAFQVVHTVDVKSILCAAFIMCKDLVDGTCLGPLALVLRQSASHFSVLEFLMNGLFIGAVFQVVHTVDVTSILRLLSSCVRI